MLRPRFTLRALLTVVAVCAMAAFVYSLLPNTVSKSDLRMVRKGMTPDEVRVILGEPLSITNLEDMSQITGDDYELWWYATSLVHYGSDWPEVSFTNGKVTSVAGMP